MSGGELLCDAVHSGGLYDGRLLPRGVDSGYPVRGGKLLRDTLDAGELLAGELLPRRIDCGECV